MWREPAYVLEIDETAVAEKFQGRKYRAAGFFGRKRVDPKDVGEVERNPAPDRSDRMDVRLSSAPANRKGGDSSRLAGENGVGDLGTGHLSSEVAGNAGADVPCPP